MAHFFPPKPEESKKSIALKKKIDDQIKKQKKMEELVVFNRVDAKRKEAILYDFDRDEKYGPTDQGLTREQRVKYSRSRGIYPPPTVTELMKETNNRSIIDLFQAHSNKKQETT